MALLVCQECNGKVSSEAESCPTCGAIQEKPTSTTTWIIGGIFATCIAVGIMQSAEQRADPPKTAAQISARQAEGKRALIADVARGILRRSARDPDSIKFESVRVSDDGKIACVELRAKNGFGGYSFGHYVVTGTAPDDSAAAWNRKCVQPMREY